jgi:type III secretory pathway component EscS
MFDDPNWLTKILIGGILGIIPIVNFVVFGYVLVTLKNVAEGKPQPLPEWGEFVDMFVKGLMLFIIILVYAIPAILIACCIGVVAGVLGAAGGQQQEALGSLIALVSLAGQCLIWLYAIVLGLVSPAIMIQYARTGEFTAAFRFGEVIGIATSNLGNYIIALILSWVASFIAGFGVIACFIGVIFTSFWAYLVAANLFGQVARGAPAAASA